ncbi:MAG: hypothetical protein IKT97_07775 [Spirochaetia bacterium]|nr:hypothetical protein [Spirochaetia bacterium]
MLIENGSTRQTSVEFWRDELQNARTLLVKVEQAIFALNSGVQEYTIDTGQTRQTVKRSDLDQLRAQRNDLLGQIAALESRLGISPRSPQVVPLW